MDTWQKRAIATGTSLLLGTTLLTAQGLAADLPENTYVPPVIEVAEDPEDPFYWDRFYGGVFLGYGWSDVVITTDSADIFAGAFFDRTLNLHGPLAGLTLGKNFAFSNENDNDTDFVLGVEGDIAIANLYTEFRAVDAANPGDGDAFISVRLNTLATLRARIGVPLGDDDTFMPYITGGLAAGHVDIFVQPDEAALNDPVSASEWLFGYTIGGGVEAAVSDNVTLKAEYLYTDLVGDISLFPVDNGIDTATFNLGGIHTIKVGLNVHF